MLILSLIVTWNATVVFVQLNLKCWFADKASAKFPPTERQSVSTGLPSVCAIKTRTLRGRKVWLFSWQSTWKYRSSCLDFSQRPRNCQTRSVGHCSNVCSMSVDPYNIASALISHCFILLLQHRLKMKNLRLFQNWLIETGASSGRTLKKLARTYCIEVMCLARWITENGKV